jgi:YegS/Rv2252/BmrU family lipid kinase
VTQRLHGATPVLINPTAGRGCPGDWLSALETGFRDRGIEARVMLLDTGEQILDAASQAVRDGASMIVAGGGDGTVSAVASCLAGTTVRLGVLPMGTLNHFAKDLGLPLALDAALDVIAHGRELAVDMGEVNGRLFINNSSLGLYPDIVLDRERQRQRLGRGKWTALLAASLHAARRYPVLSLDLEVDGKRLQRRSAFVFVGNNAYRMEGFEIGERRALSDGQLSLYLTQRTGRFGLLRLALRALAGRLQQARDFDMLAAKAVVVRTARHRMRVATDGEVTMMRTPLHYRVRPGVLRVAVPAA